MKRLVFIVLLLSWGVLAYADIPNRYQQTLADSSLAITERPAVLALPRLFLGSTRAQLDVAYTPHEGERVSLGTWNTPIRQAFADELLIDHLAYYLPVRYDRLLIQEQSILLQTATDELHWAGDFSRLPEGQVSDELLLDRVTQYLDADIVPALQVLLSDAAEVRYQEMNARERGTFITERANQLGMPAEVLESLLTAGYVFVFYVPEITGSLHIRQRLVERTLLPDYYVYDHSLTVSHPFVAQVLSFDGEGFTSFATLESSSRTLGSGRSGGSLSSRVQPNSHELMDWLETAMAGHFVNHQVGINFQLKHYEDFRIQAPLNAGVNSRLELVVGNQESIRVNQPFTFHRQIDGQQEVLGWGQVRTVGKSCRVLPEAERTRTSLVPVTGLAEAGDLAIEHPWTGITSHLKASYQANGLDLGWGETHGGAASFLDWGISGNLGYLLNKPWLSEFWLRAGFGLGYAEGGDYQRFADASFDDGLAGRLYFGLKKRWLLGSGWFLGASNDLGFEFRNHTARGEGWNTPEFSDVDLNGESFNFAVAYLLPELTVQKHFTPNLRMQVGVGYHYPLGTAAVWSDKEIRDDHDGISDFYFEDAQLEPGWTASLSFSWMLSSGGVMAGMTSAPDNYCSRLANGL